MTVKTEDDDDDNDREFGVSDEDVTVVTLITSDMQPMFTALSSAKLSFDCPLS